MARLPGALAGLLSGVVVYRLGARLWDARVGLVAGVILVTTPPFVHNATTARLDSVPTLLSLLSLLAYVRAADSVALGTLRWREHASVWRCSRRGCSASPGVLLHPLLCHHGTAPNARILRCSWSRRWSASPSRCPGTSTSWRAGAGRSSTSTSSSRPSIGRGTARRIPGDDVLRRASPPRRLALAAVHDRGPGAGGARRSTRRAAGGVPPGVGARVPRTRVAVGRPARPVPGAALSTRVDPRCARAAAGRFPKPGAAGCRRWSGVSASSARLAVRGRASAALARCRRDPRARPRARAHGARGVVRGRVSVVGPAAPRQLPLLPGDGI
jgi:hypothetical protein